jgi:hypothetical protein
VAEGTGEGVAVDDGVAVPVSAVALAVGVVVPVAVGVLVSCCA